jgi:hypothetical protein
MKYLYKGKYYPITDILPSAWVYGNVVEDVNGKTYIISAIAFDGDKIVDYLYAEVMPETVERVSEAEQADLKAREII